MGIVFQGADPASTFVVASGKRLVMNLLVNVSGEFTQCEVLQAPSTPSLHKSLLQQWEEDLPFVSETSKVFGVWTQAGEVSPGILEQCLC